MALEGEYEPSPVGWVRQQVEEFEASGGARANTLRATGDPIVVITSRGSRSGKLRKNPVMRVEKNGVYVAVGSLGGGPKDPAWVANFLAHPEVELQDGPVKRTYRPRLLSGAERQQWWDYAVSVWATYASYAKKTEREIPVFLLEPVA